MTPRKSRPREAPEAAEESAATRVTASPDVPEYLSDAWWALDLDDWRRQAAIVIAANRWAAIIDSPYGRHLLDEVWDWHKRRTYSEWSSAVSRMVKGKTIGPSYQELERRRSVLGPLYRPHPGGAVDWETGRPAHREVA
jgi:hypothetical protein